MSRKSVLSKLPQANAKKAPRPREYYGLDKKFPEWAASATQLECDQYAFAWRIPVSEGAPLREVLFQQIAEQASPGYFEWHPWTERLVSACCNNRFVAVTGCSGSAKTHNIAGFAATWWLADPDRSSVIFCSTTSKALRKRGWAKVQSFYANIPGPRVGHFIDSRMVWSMKAGDDLHAITGIAVEEGQTAKVADNIKGMHTRRQMVIIDEATAVPAAIFDAVTNLYSYPIDSGGEFLMVMLANARSRLDEFGKFMEPMNGWNSVSVEDDEEWETKAQLDGSPGICIRFDVEKSPNIVNPSPDGKLVSKHLPTLARVENRRKRPGYENDPTYWSNERGFPPPEGLNKNVFSEVAIVACDGYGRHRFTGMDFRIVGALDPARVGGDRPVLRFAATGMTESGSVGIELMAPIEILLDATSKNPIDFQLAEQVRRECENVNYRGQTGRQYYCEPQNLGVDASGGGADLVDIMHRTWSPLILRIISQESPSTDSVSHEDVRPADEVYRNKRAEMYFRARHALDSQQLRGFDLETAKEICTVTFDDRKEKIVLTSKEDYRKKFSKSPDLSDSACMCVEVARKKGFRLAALGETVKIAKSFDKLVAAANGVYENSDFRPEEPWEEEDNFPDDALTA